MSAIDLIGRRLPRIRATSLSRVAYDLPADLQSPATLLVVAFRQRQQADVDSWLPVARRLAGRGLAFFEVPLIDLRWRPVRRWIDGGMRSGIPDPTVRNTTLTAYQRRASFLRELGLLGIDRIAALVVDPDGIIRWAALGPLASHDMEVSLEEAVVELLG